MQVDGQFTKENKTVDLQQTIGLLKLKVHKPMVIMMYLVSDCVKPSPIMKEDKQKTYSHTL